MVNLYRRKGADTLVNTQTASDQNQPDVAALSGGGYVVVWGDGSLAGGDSSGSGIKGQRFDPDGNKVGGEFLVNTTLSGSQVVATVAALPSGRFVVTWSDPSATGGDTSSFAVRGQMFEANGTPVGGEFLINTVTSGNQSTSSVTALAGGGFAVTWSDASATGNDTSGFGIKAQLFDSSAAKVGGEISVNTTTAGSQNNSSVIGLPSGGFAAAWISAANSTKLQLFDSTGAKVGSEIRVNATGGSGFSRANIAVLADGFLVSWTQFNGNFDFANDVRAQRFDLNGAKVGSEFVVHTGLAGNQGVSDAVALPGGGFIITWQGPDEATAGNVFGQIFDSAGARVGGEFVVSSVTGGDQLSPKVAAMASGDIVVVWSDTSGTGGDSSGFAVKSQILAPGMAPTTGIALSATTLNENAIENVAVATLSASGALNSLFTFQIMADSTGGAFRIDGDKLVVDDNARLDFETAPQATLTIRAIDLDGQIYDKIVVLDVTDIVQEKRFSASGEILVNVNEAGSESSATVIPLTGGGFAMLWTKFNGLSNDPIPNATLLRLYDSAGVPQSGEILIADKWIPSLTASPLANGGFVLVREVFNSTTNMFNIKAQTYDSGANPVGAEMVAGSVPYDFSDPVLVQLDSGGFVISWKAAQPGVIDAQRFDSAGTAVGAEFAIANEVDSTPLSLVATPNGGFAASWLAYDGTGRVQFYDSANAPAGFLSVELGSDPGSLTLLALAGGGYMLAWRELVFDDGSGLTVQAVMGQPIGASGAAIGDPVVLGSYTGPHDSGSVDFAAHPDGGFVATWPMFTATDVLGSLEGQLFDSLGAPVGPHFQAAPATWDESGVGVLADGSIVVSWIAADSDQGGTFVRVYRAADEPSDLSGDNVLTGDPGANTLDGQGGDDQLYGLGGDDGLIGGAGNDLLDGGTGADSMSGGDGNDVYAVDNAGDSVSEAPGGGTDEVKTALASFSLVAVANVEKLTATSAAAHDFRGNSGDNVITGGGGNDVLRLQDGGNDTVLAGAGNDNIFFIGSLTAADVVNGGDGGDTLVLQGAYGALTLTANITQIEGISLLGGNNIVFGEPGTNRYDYVLTVNNANFAAGVQAKINGAALLEGEDFTFDGSAETDALFVVYGGRGRDTLTGGLNNDIFFYAEDRFATGDTVNGGAGYDGMFLRGNYTIDFNAPGYTGLFTNIENLTLTSATDERYARGGGSEFDYNLVLSNAIVKPGETLTVSGALLMASETMILDASQETDGLLRLFGGKAGDTLKGGGQADLIYGNLGADILAGNGGADTFRYQSVAESNSAIMDQILDFAAGTDRIELTRIDADTLTAGDQAFSWIGANAFSGSAGQLRAYQDGVSWFVEGDVDGDGAADLVIQVNVTGGLLTQNDFLP